MVVDILVNSLITKHEGRYIDEINGHGNSTVFRLWRVPMRGMPRCRGLPSFCSRGDNPDLYHRIKLSFVVFMENKNMNEVVHHRNLNMRSQYVIG